ncbi:hypothetical protein N656DRAFT_648082 [Canariomyces notabilis]|uniref:Uncharacterized protein n=1 Tax=Canariomyces notabilis TaxID=2074819 RepID=A0AAN6TEY6_9PEZI|nr:hypothetical protein N656DRAFT_648082 [Canariomyces arenarius]
MVGSKGVAALGLFARIIDYIAAWNCLPCMILTHGCMSTFLLLWYYRQELRANSLFGEVAYYVGC